MARKNKNKMRMLPLAIVLLLVVGVGAVFYYGGFLQESFYEPVYKQNYGNIRCELDDNIDELTRYTDDVTSFKCDTWKNECSVTLEKANVWLLGHCVAVDRCTIEGTNCVDLGNYCWNGFDQSPKPKKIEIKNGEMLKFTDSGKKGITTFNAQWKNARLVGEENGELYVAEGCRLNSALKKRVLDDGLNELQLGQFQNYMIDFIETATRTYTYEGKEVVCQSRQVYSIDELDFKDGSTKKIQRNRVASVECCPSEANCNADTFSFVEENTRECTITAECPNGGNPVPFSGSTYVTFNCVDDICKQSNPVSVECTNNQICVTKYGPGSVCDLSTNNYGKCKDASGPIGYCGDGVCEGVIGETQDSCPADCGGVIRSNGIPIWVWILVGVGVFLIILSLFSKRAPGPTVVLANGRPSVQ